MKNTLKLLVILVVVLLCPTFVFAASGSYTSSMSPYEAHEIGYVANVSSGTHPYKMRVNSVSYSGYARNTFPSGSNIQFTYTGGTTVYVRRSFTSCTGVDSSFGLNSPKDIKVGLYNNSSINCNSVSADWNFA